MIGKLFIAFSLCLAFGCSSTPKYVDQNEIKDSKPSMKADFNQETYIWESLYFPTNRTER